MSQQLSEVDFDTRIFGRRVGEIKVVSEDFGPEAEYEIIQHAQRQGFEIVYLALEEKVPTDYFQFVGSLENWSGMVSEALTKTELASSRIRSGFTPEVNWAEIGELLCHTGQTRFSNDKVFEWETVRVHKIELLKAYRSRFPSGMLSAHRDGSEGDYSLLGFHLGFPKDGEWVLYELLVHPSVRTGMLALALVGNVLRRGLEENASLHTIRSKIYGDNQKSKNFFSHLGLKATGEVTHYYHYHLEFEASSGRGRDAARES